jgi:tRNA A-37 threonylcarbamoyl transferase component Bud32
MAARSPIDEPEIDRPLKVNKERGTRVVYAGRFKNRPAIIKVYSHPVKKRLHWFLCHFHGRVLRRRGVPAPEIWYSGYAPSLSGYVIIYERLADPRDFYWIRNETDRGRRLEGYMKVLPLLACMHARGIAQKDTTPGNFLESGGIVLAIDEDRMDVRPWPLGKRASLKNLASLITQFAPENPEDTDQILLGYMEKRGWDADLRWQHYLEANIRRFRAWRDDKRGYEKHRNALIAAAGALAAAAIWLFL